MTLKEKLQMMLCDPEGKVCIHGSEEDLKMLQEIIEEAGKFESTELTDTNGKEIREGDFVKMIIRTGNNIINPQGNVAFKFGCFGLVPTEYWRKEVGKVSFLEEDFIPLHQANYGIEIII